MKHGHTNVYGDDYQRGLHRCFSTSKLAASWEAETKLFNLWSLNQRSPKWQANLLPWRKIVIIFMGLALCNLIDALDSTIVATALPTISASFHAGSTLAWALTAYLLFRRMFHSNFSSSNWWSSEVRAMPFFFMYPHCPRGHCGCRGWRNTN